MRRRTFLAAGAAAAAGLAGALYAPLVVGDGFEAFVGDALGLDEDVARDLLGRMHDELGEAEYAARAGAFAVALRSPLAALVPGGLRDHAVHAFVEPLLGGPSRWQAYVRERPPAAACGGLQPVR
ncbi:MAG: hypothetical protein HZB46_06070 [Solirubrobacterales bacterium]|nr:hypothetical protein [Solirubrobacterales bacterium]